ncbi:hypothetical protein C8R45DRAFT_1174424 [Mycena sanguinolenta]|nr:hypothetical protein C8R45DRAFT_1174424 [Mycena sanguinolenta]
MFVASYIFILGLSTDVHRTVRRAAMREYNVCRRVDCRTLPLHIAAAAAASLQRQNPFAQLVASNLARLERLKVALLLDELRPIASSIPRLHHLDIHIPRLTSLEPVLFNQLQVPLLRSVVLSGIASQCVRLPWAQLTSLALYNVGLETFVPILSQTSNLIHCELHIRRHRREVTDLGRAPTLLSLECLILKAYHDDHPFEYLKFFITPALSRLALPERFLGPDPLRSLTDFMSKSGAKLQEVCITGRRLTPKNSYRGALQSVPKWSFSKQVHRRILRSRAKLEIERDSDTD